MKDQTPPNPPRLKVLNITLCSLYPLIYFKGFPDTKSFLLQFAYVNVDCKLLILYF